MAASQKALQEAPRNVLHEEAGTTLIVVVAKGDQLGYSYIGDGGLYIHHLENDKRADLLRPHKNIPCDRYLHSALGPRMPGDPVFGTAELRSGDIVVAGTDGIMDFDWSKGCYRPIDAEFVIKKIRARSGSLQFCLEGILTTVCRQRIKDEPVINDNVTLGAICA